MKKRALRSGFTTGACAAAAAKAAAQILAGAYRDAPASDVEALHSTPLQISIPFPDGSRHEFKIHNWGFRDSENAAFASVIKDAGDDPDVTNGAEIAAEARLVRNPSDLIIKGGKGVGIVTKPGLAVAVGEPAINPVPRQMIADAVAEIGANGRSPLQLFPDSVVEITIYIPEGEALAKKTLNERLGIVGGLSILGTTGHVRPLSAEAWTATITSSMEVARAMGNTTLVLSAGRASEKAHMKRFSFPEESYVMMGDYLEFSIREAARLGFAKIHLCAQWAKMLKIAMSIPQTHVRHGAIDMDRTVEFLKSAGASIPEDKSFNTARELFDYLQSAPLDADQMLRRVCNSAKDYIAVIANPLDTIAYLVSYNGEIIACSE